MDWQAGIGRQTADDIARALGHPSAEGLALPPDVEAAVTAERNSPAEFGQRMKARIQDLIDHPDSFTPSYHKRYTTLLDHCHELTPQAAYAMAMLLGKDSSRGYHELAAKPTFAFPAAHVPELDYQVGWHFFVGSCWDTEGQEYGVQLMFWTVALLPPKLAASYGLSDLENQVMELHLAISVAGDRHYRGAPVVIAGTSGLIEVRPDPLLYRMGASEIRALESGSFVPLHLAATSWNREGEPIELGVDLVLGSGKKPFLEGKDGALPSIGGVGTLYYSIPRMVLDGTRSSLRVGDRQVKLERGNMWFDHQWGTGFAPAGSPRSGALRAAGDLGPQTAVGWDWFMVQFGGGAVADVASAEAGADPLELTVYAMHSDENARFYDQTGPEPPGTMTVPVGGSWLDAAGDRHLTSGTMSVTSWVKAESSPDPALYPATHVWYPDRWEYTMEGDLPEVMRSFVLTPVVEGGQAGFFGTGAQYSEGAVRAQAPGADGVAGEPGREVGRGFAESVNYASSVANPMHRAGLPDTPEVKALMDPPHPGLFLKLHALGHLARPGVKHELEGWADAIKD